jgi:hypothetical protein
MSVVSVAVLTVLTVLAVVLLTVVASSGAVRVWTEPPVPEVRSSADRGAAVRDEPEAAALPPISAPQDLEPPDTWWWRVIAVAVLLLLLRVAWIVVSVYWQLLRGRWERWSRPAGSLSPLPGSDGADDVDVSFDLTARLAQLQVGAPRNAIVACWSQLEDDVAAAGLPRDPAETSVEYTERVLSSASVDTAATLELAELYRVARFSDHPIDEAGRARAVQALQRVHASLRVREPDAVT